MLRGDASSAALCFLKFSAQNRLRALTQIEPAGAHAFPPLALRVRNSGESLVLLLQWLHNVAWQERVLNK